MSVLLVHAGGDSKRVPWANPIGKAFLPLPCLIEDDEDEQAPSLFDHILALSSFVVQDFGKQGMGKFNYECSLGCVIELFYLLLNF